MAVLGAETLAERRSRTGSVIHGIFGAIVLWSFADARQIAGSGAQSQQRGGVAAHYIAHLPVVEPAETVGEFQRLG